MTNEERKLLIKDTLGRMPYSLYIENKGDKSRSILHTISVYPIFDGNKIGDCSCDVELKDGRRVGIDECMPLLRPIGTMTDDELKHLRWLCHFGYPSDDYDKYDHRGVEVLTFIYDSDKTPHYMSKMEYDSDDLDELADYLNSRYIDYRGLIEKGLAIDAGDIYAGQL